MTTRLIVTFLKAACLITVCIASELSFVVSPQDGKTVLYPLQLNCSVKRAEFSPTAMQILKDDSGTWTVIAGLNDPDTTEVKYSIRNLDVEGRLSNQSLSRLTATWKRPTLSQNGQYICWARERASNEMVQTTLNVSLESPSFQDLLDFSRKQASVVQEQGALLVNLYGLLKEQQETIRNTSNELSNARAELTNIRPGALESSFQDLLIASNEQKSRIEKQEAALRNISEVLNYQDNNLNYTRNEIVGVKADLDQLQPRVQEGKVYCGSYRNYSSVRPFWKMMSCGPYLEKVVTVVFRQPYPRPPFVTLQLSGIGTNQVGNGTKIIFNKRDVTTTGFRVVCRTWCGSQINYLTLNWQAKNN